MAKQPVNEIYFIRTLACLSIVLLHSIEATLKFHPSLSVMSIESTKLYETLALVLKYGTPVFVLISIFLLAYSYPDKAPKGFLKKRAKFLLIPFVVMGAFYALLEAYISNLSLNELASEVFRNLFLGGYHGYFILIVFQFYLLYILFQKYAKKFKPLTVLSLCLIINFAYLSVFNFVESPNSTYGQYIWERFSWLPFVGWIFYFAIGYYSGLHLPKLRKFVSKNGAVLTLLAVIFGAMVVYNFNNDIISVHSSKRVDMLFFSSSLFFLLFFLGTKIKTIPRFIMTINNYSFSVYLLHFFYIALINKFIEGFSFIPFPAYAAILLIGSTALSMLSSYIMNKFSFGKYLVGNIQITRKTYESNQTSHVPTKDIA